MADAYDKAFAETAVGSFKDVLTRRQGPWRHVDQVEVGTLNRGDWFNHRRPYGYSDDLTPIEAEQAHYAHRQAPATAGVSS